MGQQDDSIFEEFLVESRENLDQIERDLVALEQDPSSPELLAQVFRAFHTIKGNCGFLGFSRLQTLTHAAEGLLARCRDGHQPLDSRMSGALLDVVDDARRILRSIETQRNEADADVTARVETLRGLLESAPEPPAPSVPAVAAAAPGSAAPGPAPPGAAPAVEPPAPRPAGATPGVEHPSFGLFAPLIESGRLTAAAAAQAEMQQRMGDPRRIGEILVQQGTLKPEDVLDALVMREAGERTAADSKVRVDVRVLDRLMNLASELVMTRNQVLQCVATQELAALTDCSQRLNLITSELQEEIVKTRMQPIRQVWDKLPRLARDVAGVCGRRVRLELEGTETELDRTVLEAIRDPLIHLVRNAIGHGIEDPAVREARGKDAEGRVSLCARHHGGQVLIEVTDDGAGIAVDRLRQQALEKRLVRPEQAAQMTEAEWLAMVFVPGLSTAENVTALSGRGVGMDVVKTNIERIGGTVEVRSERGKGTTFVLRLPLTLAIVPALIVMQDGQRYAIPRASVQELLQLRAGEGLAPVEWVGRLPFHRLRHRLLSLVPLADALRSGDPASSRIPGLASAEELQVVVVNGEGYTFGLVVDEILDAEEIVVKPLEDPFKNQPALAGATLLGDGRVALILDMSGIGRSLHLECATERSAEFLPPAEAAPSARANELLVEARADWRIAVPCGAITRLEEIPLGAIQRTRGGDVVQYRGRLMPVLDLAGLLDPVAPPEQPESAKVPVLVVERDGRALGLGVRAVLDIVAAAGMIEPVAGRPGIRGESVIDGLVTDHLDLEAALAIAARRLQLAPAEAA